MKTEEILKQAGQLSVRQLATYHTLMQIKKILTNRQPEYLYRRLSENVRTHTYSLRNRTPGDIIRSRTNLSITKNSFIERGTEAWNKLPTQLREEPLKAFKKHLRSWVRTNVPISIKKGNGWAVKEVIISCVWSVMCQILSQQNKLILKNAATDGNMHWSAQQTDNKYRIWRFLETMIIIKTVHPWMATSNLQFDTSVTCWCLLS